MTPHVIEGQQVEVLIYDSTIQKSEWNPGFQVKAVRSALDRPYRIDVTDGRRRYRDAAPECVRVTQQVAA